VRLIFNSQLPTFMACGKKIYSETAGIASMSTELESFKSLKICSFILEKDPLRLFVRISNMRDHL
jgi:hypothetical protein